MSAIEAGSGRLCSQCQSIVKNILPSNDGRLTTTPLRPEVAEAAAQLHAPPQQAPSPPKYDASRPESTQSNGGSSETRMTFDQVQLAADEPAIKFETEPLEEAVPAPAKVAAPATNFKESRGALQTALRESGALRETQVPEASLLEEFETLRQKAETKETTAAPAARPNKSAEPESKPAAFRPAPVEPQQMVYSGQREPRQPIAPYKSQPESESNVVNFGSQEWPVLINNPQSSGSGQWKVLLALGVVFAVTAVSTLYYFLIVKPKRAAAKQEFAAKLNPQGSATASPAGAKGQEPPAASPGAQPSGGQPAGTQPAASQPAASQPAVPAGTTNDPSGRFALQAASFPSPAAAGEFATKLVRAGVPAYVVSAEIPKRGRWYRVRVGKFSSQDDANKFAGDAKLRAKTAGITLALVVCDYEKPD